MIKLFFVSIYFYLKAIILAVCEYKNKDALFYSGKDLFYKLSFRNSMKSKNDFFFSLRCLKRMWFRILHTNNSFLELSESGSTIVDAHSGNRDLRIKYVEHFTKKKVRMFIAKNELPFGFSVLHKTFFMFILIFFSPMVILLSLFDKQKQRWPMIFNELFEYICLAWLLKNKKIKELHYFCIYEKDANIVAWLLMRQNIYVNKIPSEVPLYFFNKVIVASELSFCFAYQQEEFIEYQQTMFVDKTNLWAPEQILKAPQRFLSKNKINPQYDIGFFSSGNWLRSKLGDIDLGYNDKENEELVLKALITYVKNNNLKLRLFIHPLEKKLINKAVTQAYYYEFLQNTNVSIADYKIPSIDGFDEINIGVSLYSTLMFERIYLGFKTIIAPFGYDQFPIKQSSLKNICVTHINELFDKLDSNLNLNTQDFFQKNQISKYSIYIN